MYCPNCGNKNSQDQKYCRSCGLGLEKVVQTLTEQLPTRKDLSIEQQKERFERLGVAALGIFGLGILSFVLYGIIYKVMITQGNVLAGLGYLGIVLVLGCGLLSVVLFAKANELKDAKAKREIRQPGELAPDGATRELSPERHTPPVFSVTDRTTELLAANLKDENRSS